MVTYHDVAELISEGKIVAIFQGPDEAGPRALGNRSILYDPRDPEAKHKINIVKRREWYRPFAASVMLEYASDYFDLAGLPESPYMTYAMDAHPKVYDIIPGVLHVDKTCRIQTVTKEQNYNYYMLLDAFRIITGVPMVFNTSFNLSGDTIVHSEADALDTLNRSAIDFVYFPDSAQLCTS
tara:strand:- start:140 stop:682 length:543 start_codon:yes stop_codon:yes gene_type:complete